MEALANRPTRDRRHRKIPGATNGPARDARYREIPLAVVMVALTTITLWSLGQAILVESVEAGAPAQLASR
jgi:hypothetical protein